MLPQQQAVGIQLPVYRITQLTRCGFQAQSRITRHLHRCAVQGNLQTLTKILTKRLPRIRVRAETVMHMAGTQRVTVRKILLQHVQAMQQGNRIPAS